MKFRVVVSTLIVLILGMFAYAMYLTYKIEGKNQELSKSYDELKKKDDSLSNSYAALKRKDSMLEITMQELDVFTEGAQEKRRKQLARGKFDLGIEVQARNKEYMDLIAFTIGSGFNLEYANQKRGFLNRSVVYYYSDAGKKIADELKIDLKNKFPKLADFDIQQGSSGSSNTITAKLRFRY